MRHLLTVLLVSTLLAGCSVFDVQVDRYSPITYRLSSTYGSAPETLARARARLRAKANSLCPMGWYRSADYDRFEGGSRAMFWVITCNRPYPSTLNAPR